MDVWMLTLPVTIALFGNSASLPEPTKQPCEDLCHTVKCTVGAICVTNPVTCKPKCICNGGCPRNFDPVCGSDGNTYDNECLLNLASCKSGGKIKKVSDGECPTKQPCEDLCHTVKCTFGAICVTNPVTCEPKCICNGGCPRNFDPVCGSDGNTYGNECLLNLASCKSGGKIKKVSDGECPKTEMRRENLKPPCGNKCQFTICVPGAICVVNPISCEPKCICNGGCPFILDPVCGSDGKTYDNECLLNFASCKSGGKIKKVSDGKCRICNGTCPHNYLPVCGSDERTCANKCLLTFASCRSRGKIKKVSDGECWKS